MGLTTSPNALRYPVGGDSASLLATYFKNLADDVQANLTVFSDAEPTKQPGLMWYAPTAATLKITDGSSWVQLLGDTGWHNLDLVTTGSNPIIAGVPVPQVRVKDGEFKFQGLAQPSGGGNFPTATLLVVAATLPSALGGLIPAYKVNQPVSGSTPAGNGRGIFNTDGSVSVLSGATASGYFDLASLSGALTN